MEFPAVVYGTSGYFSVFRSFCVSFITNEFWRPGPPHILLPRVYQRLGMVHGFSNGQRPSDKEGQPRRSATPPIFF
jgi:hypothetical protein